MMFMPVFSSYAITDMLGDDKTSVFGAKIAALFESTGGGGAYGTGAALSFVLLVIVMVAMVIGNVLSKKAEKAPVKGGKA